MKSILSILLIAACANAANVEINLADFTTTGITNRLVHITPRVAPRAVDAFVLTRDRRYFYTDTNGLMIASNVVEGSYTVELMGPYARSQFCLYIPQTNGTINATNWIESCNSAAIDAEDGTPIDLE